MNGTRYGRVGGFTMVEMLVVIGILGILSAALLSMFGSVKEKARNLQAQNLVGEVATAFTRYLQDHRVWPAEWSGALEMDAQVCRVLQSERLMDVTPFKRRANGTLTAEEDKTSLDRFGLLDPWAQLALKRAMRKGMSTVASTDEVSRGRTFANHRIQYRLDKNYDGFVDNTEGSPQGVRVRAAVLVWSRGPDGKDDFDQDVARYPKDDSLSWPHAKYISGQ
jgi:prepilin-type N-terminal cleavage/methylation domain-containing protein